MKFVLVVAASILSGSAWAAPVNTAQAAIKIGCASIHAHLPSDASTCSDFQALLRGDVWTVSHKQVPANMFGGGAPVVEISQETGEVLNFYLTE
jgi:hypothetical protein